MKMCIRDRSLSTVMVTCRLSASLAAGVIAVGQAVTPGSIPISTGSAEPLKVNAAVLVASESVSYTHLKKFLPAKEKTNSKKGKL